MAVKKNANKAVKKANSKKPVAKPKQAKANSNNEKPAGRSVKKDIKRLKKAAKKVNKKTIRHDRQLELLRQEIEKLKAKKKKKGLTAYNLFMKHQINLGFTFNQAVNHWNVKKKKETKELTVSKQKVLALKAPEKKAAVKKAGEKPAKRL